MNVLSVVIPILNEEESILKLYQELISVLKNLQDYEIIFADDGSTDSSLKKLQELASKDTNVIVFSFRRNLGKSEALTLGFQKAKGEYIATLDADLQDQPQDIPKLLEKLEKGWDVVCGWRKNRKDPVKKVISSKIFNASARIFWGLRLHDYNCGLKVYRSEAAKSLNLYGGLHRFIPLLLHQQAYRVTEEPVLHSKRQFGKSKYGFSKLWKDLPDIFTMLFLSHYGDRPLHFFGVIGGFLFFVGSVILLYLAMIKLGGQGIGNRPILFLGMLLVLTGLQVLFTGFLADLLINLLSRKEKKFDLKYFSE